MKEGFVPLIPHIDSRAALPCLSGNFLLTPCLRQIFRGKKKSEKKLTNFEKDIHTVKEIDEVLF